MKNIILVIALTAVLGACSAQRVEDNAAKINSDATAVQAGCNLASPLAGAAIGIPVIGAYVAAGVTAACTADGIVKLASDPSSAAWLGQQAQMLKDALAKFRSKVARKETILPAL